MPVHCHLRPPADLLCRSSYTNPCPAYQTIRKNTRKDPHPGTVSDVGHEPRGALELKLREDMQVELRRFQKELGTTAVYVTHEQTEAMRMSEQMAVMDTGRLIQLDAPTKIYYNNRTRFVAGPSRSCRILR